MLFPVCRKCGHRWYEILESKITITAVDKQLFNYWSQTTSYSFKGWFVIWSCSWGIVFNRECVWCMGFETVHDKSTNSVYIE